MTELTNKGMADAWVAAETELAMLMARLTKAQKALAEANRVAGAALESNSANAEEMEKARRRIAELVADRSRYWGRWRTTVRELQEEKAAHRATCVQLARAQQDETTANRVADRVPELERELDNVGLARAELERKLEAYQTELAAARGERDHFRHLWLDGAGAQELEAELAQARDRATQAEKAAADAGAYRNMAATDRDAWRTRAQSLEKAEADRAALQGKTFEALGAARLEKANVQAKLDEALAEAEKLRDERNEARQEAIEARAARDHAKSAAETWRASADYAIQKRRETEAKLERAEPLFAAAREWHAKWLAWGDDATSKARVMYPVQTALVMAAEAWAREEAGHV